MMLIKVILGVTLALIGRMSAVPTDDLLCKTKGYCPPSVEDNTTTTRQQSGLPPVGTTASGSRDDIITTLTISVQPSNTDQSSSTSAAGGQTSKINAASESPADVDRVTDAGMLLSSDGPAAAETSISSTISSPDKVIFTTTAAADGDTNAISSVTVPVSSSSSSDASSSSIAATTSITDAASTQSAAATAFVTMPTMMTPGGDQTATGEQSTMMATNFASAAEVAVTSSEQRQTMPATIGQDRVTINSAERSMMTTAAAAAGKIATTAEIGRLVTTTVSGQGSTVAVVLYTLRCRIKNKQFSDALSDKTSVDYYTLNITLFPILTASYKNGLGNLFLGIVEISFSRGSIVVENQLSLGAAATDAMLNQTAAALVDNFAQNGFQLDSVAFVIYAPPRVPPPDSVDNILLIALAAGVLVVVVVCVLALSVLICRRRCRPRDGSSSSSGVGSRESIVSTDPSRSSMSVDYDHTMPAGLPPARRASQFWKANKTAMRDPGEFDDHYTYYRSVRNQRQLDSSRRPVGGYNIKSAALPAAGSVAAAGGKRRRTASKTKHQQSAAPAIDAENSERQPHSETESSDWRFIALAPDSNRGAPGGSSSNRPLTGWLQRAVNNAAGGRNIDRPPSSSRHGGGRRLPRQHQQQDQRAIMNDVDDEDDDINVGVFDAVAYPADVVGHQRQQPAAAGLTGWSHQQQQQQRAQSAAASGPPLPRRPPVNSGRFLGPQFGGAGNGPMIGRGFNQDNMQLPFQYSGLYGPPVARPALIRRPANTRLQRDVYVPPF